MRHGRRTVETDVGTRGLGKLNLDASPPASEAFADISNVDHGLSPRQLATVCNVLAPWADRITAVDLFGSRATGAWRPNSDLDLLLHGTLDDRAIDRLWTLFHESNLPFAVDVTSYDLTTHKPLREHMDRVRKPLLVALDDGGSTSVPQTFRRT